FRGACAAPASFFIICVARPEVSGRPPHLSPAGLTRGPIIFVKLFAKKMDCRVKPGNDDHHSDRDRLPKRLNPIARPSAARSFPLFSDGGASLRAIPPGARPAGSSPIAAKRSRNVGDWIAVLSLSMIGRGTPAGAITPLQVGAA